MQSTSAIVLRTIKYGETSLIVHLYTQLFGVQSFMVKGVRKQSKKGASKANIFTIGNILNISTTIKPNKSLQVLAQFQLEYVHTNIASSVIKYTIIVFITELLHHTIHEPEPNAELFEYLIQLIKEIEMEPIAMLNYYPHLFCIQLASYLGFEINQHQSGAYFNLKAGYFQNDISETQQFCSKENSSLLLELLQYSKQTTVKNIGNKRALLRDLIMYFKLHIPHMQAVKCLDVLEVIF
jgi:DNA repair protein RecO (recombination protein O)